MLCLSRLGLIFKVVMSANHGISDSDIFLELSIIVMKYSFKFINHDPLCKKNSKKNSLRRRVREGVGVAGVIMDISR